MKEKEIWMQKLKEKLDDYSEPIPAFGWEQLEKELLPLPEKRLIPYRRRTMVAAAAVLLAAISSVSLYFLNSPMADQMRQTSVSVLPTIPDAMPKQQEAALQVAKTELASVRKAATHLMPTKLDQSEEVLPTDTSETEKGTETATTIRETKQEQEKVEQGATERLPKKEARRPSSKDKLHLPQESPVAQSGQWSISASVGNAGALTANGSNAEGLPPSRMQMDMVSSPNGIVKIPDGQTVVFQDGVPYLQNTKIITDITHHQPVSFGLSVRKELNRGFSVETGLTYTLLSSDVKMGGERAEKQKLHYMGIPVRANWNFVRKKSVTLYVAAGGAVEKCVYGELANEKQTVNPLQFSLNGAIGAQINATDRLGFYIEPGVSYFFNDGSQMQTIRKETPCNFNLQAGVRFTY